MLLLLVIVDMARGLLSEDERELSELRPSSMREGRCTEIWDDRQNCVAFTLVGDPHLSSKSSHIDYIKTETSSWPATVDLHMLISFSLFRISLTASM